MQLTAFHIVVVLALLFFAPNSREQETEFSVFVSNLRLCQMPLAIDDGLVRDSAALSCMPCADSTDSVLFARFGFGTVVFGRLFPGQPYVSILSGEIAEFNEATLQTFLMSGQKIDSLYIGGGTGGDDREWKITNSLITEDYLVSSIDTTFKWKSPERRNLDPDSTIVETSQYRILESGKIVQVQKTRKVLSD